MKYSEHEEQKTVVCYCKIKNIPIVAIPNAQMLSFLDRNIACRVSVKLKAGGMAKGFPDLFIPLVREKGGLFIEMKRSFHKGKLPKGVVSKDQKAWIEQLNENGYKAVVCYGADEAIKTIQEYMK